jgi:hypothetical protein
MVIKLLLTWERKDMGKDKPFSKGGRAGDLERRNDYEIQKSDENK